MISPYDWFQFRIVEAIGGPWTSTSADVARVLRFVGFRNNS